MYLLGGTSSGTWSPGIFVGVMVDGDDHGPNSVNSVDGSGPEACVVVDIHRDYHGAYLNNQAYAALVQTLRWLWPNDAEPTRPTLVIPDGLGATGLILRTDRGTGCDHHVR